MSLTQIDNLAFVVTGRMAVEPVRDTSIVIEDGVIVGIGERAESADVVIDAAGLSAIPGPVDGHVHPTFGEWTPAQNSMWGNQPILYSAAQSRALAATTPWNASHSAACLASAPCSSMAYLLFPVEASKHRSRPTWPRLAATAES